MTFDPMAAAIDWLDAYREEDLEQIIAMYADNTKVYCNCVCPRIVSGSNELRKYWVDRMRDNPAYDLVDLHPMGNGARISFDTRLGAITALLKFDTHGRIAEQNCQAFG